MFPSWVLKHKLGYIRSFSYILPLPFPLSCLSGEEWALPHALSSRPPHVVCQPQDEWLHIPGQWSKIFSHQSSLVSVKSWLWCGDCPLQGKLPLASMTVTKLEDCEAHKNAFELNGEATWDQARFWVQLILLTVPSVTFCFCPCRPNVWPSPGGVHPPAGPAGLGGALDQTDQTQRSHSTQPQTAHCSLSHGQEPMITHRHTDHLLSLNFYLMFWKHGALLRWFLTFIYLMHKP